MYPRYTQLQYSPLNLPRKWKNAMNLTNPILGLIAQFGSMNRIIKLAGIHYLSPHEYVISFMIALCSSCVQHYIWTYSMGVCRSS